MNKYKNKKNDIIILTDSVLSGAWELVEDKKTAKAETIAKVE